MIIDLKNCSLAIEDGDSPANTVDIKLAEGMLNWSIKRNIDYITDRGILSQTKAGDEEPMEVKFDFIYEFIMTKSGEDTSIEDALKQANAASAWVSSDADACRPYAVNLILTHTPVCTDNDIETITFPNFRYESLDHDPKAGKISCSGKCNATKPTVARTAQ